MAGRSLFAVDSLDELVEDLCVELVLAKVDDVNVHLFLLELLGQLDQVLLFNLTKNENRLKKLIEKHFLLTH